MTPVIAQTDTRTWLETAAVWRFFSFCFRLPDRPLRAEIRAVVSTLPANLKMLARRLAKVPLKDWEAEYHRVLGAGGIPASESSYDDNALAGRGPLLADVRGFYEAFAYQPEKPPAEVPDHLAVELDFLSYLALKIAFAQHEGRTEEKETTRNAFGRFLEQHVRGWVPLFQSCLSGVPSPLYQIAAASLCERLGVRLPPSAVPFPRSSAMYALERRVPPGKGLRRARQNQSGKDERP